jgi:Uri superfamily endonuclease
MSNVCAKSIALHKVGAVDSGAYQLIIRLDKDRSFRVGALGLHSFVRGQYVYTGRASKNLKARLARHLSKKKKLRWYIDYFLQWGTVIGVTVFPGLAESECSINLETVRHCDYVFPVQGFGSSDCRCPSHLIWAREADAGPLQRKIGTEI